MIFQNTDSYGIEGFANLSVNDDYASTSDDPEGDILKQFNKALSILNYKPGNTKEYLQPVCEMILKSRLDSDNTEKIMNGMVESLFEQVC